MRKITLDEIQPGMYLSKPLVLDGMVLLHEGIEMKQRYIEYLRKKGITSLFVGDKLEQPAAEELYDLTHRQQAVASAHKTLNRFQVGRGVRLDAVKEIVSNMIEELSQKPESMVHLLDIRRKKEYMFSHGVNTCILSVMTGIALGYTSSQLNELGLAAMIHDIGKTKFSQKLALQYPGYLDREAIEEYKRHPFYALEILRENQAISVNVVNACFQHHERWNGSGYPMGLQKDSISEYAQIIGIADTYDRLISSMPHRLPTPVYLAVAVLNKAAGEYFNPAMVDKFTENAAIYPMGKTVRLNTQQRGVILGTGIKNKTTPIVRITTDENGRPMDQPVELDLLKNPDLFIVEFDDTYFNYAQAYADHAYAGQPPQGQFAVS